jgi:hypothetical protein
MRNITKIYSSINRYIDNILEKPNNTPISNSFDKSNLDINNTKPNGGPINEPKYNYEHKFTPKNGYSQYISKYKNKDFIEQITNKNRK